MRRGSFSFDKITESEVRHQEELLQGEPGMRDEEAASSSRGLWGILTAVGLGSKPGEVWRVRRCC